MAPRLGLLIAALALAGCGGDREPAGATAAGTATPAGIVERARDCGLPATGSDEVPADLARLVGPRAVVLSVQEAGAGYRAVVFSDEPLVQTLATLERAGHAAGYRTEFREREAIDAELTVRSADGSAFAFTLATPPGCDAGVRVTAVRIG